MEKSVRVVFSRHESEKVIEKSRFLTYSAHVENEEEAKAFIADPVPEQIQHRVVSNHLLGY